jgi:arylsulfatase A-like enzyme
MIKLPGSPQTASIAVPVSTTAVTPTILELCGIATDSSAFSVPSLAAHWSTVPPQPQPLYATGLLYYQDRESVIADSLKYIYTFEGGYLELYDSRSDPGEHRNEAGTRPEDVARIAQYIAEIRARADALRQQNGLDSAAPAPAPLAPDAERALDSVGYL